jgi:hypothetical protein
MRTLQEAEGTYANFEFPDAIVQALAEVDRSTSKRSTSWSLREGVVTVSHVGTEHNPADLFTKILSRQPFEKHRKVV